MERVLNHVRSEKFDKDTFKKLMSSTDYFYLIGCNIRINPL